MNSIPVIFIHSGFPDYLHYTIKQACKNNKVILIGTDNQLPNEPNLTFYNLNEFYNLHTEFVKIYEHKSTLNYGFETFCFFRWFVLNAFMKKHNLDIVFYVDSDVMLYVDVTKEYPKYTQFDFTLLYRSSPCSSFFTKKGLNNFCKFVVDTYNDKESYSYKKIMSHFDVRRSCNLDGGVCDMTFFDFFHYWADKGGPGRVGEMMTIVDDTTYDSNYNCPDQDFEYDGKHKVVEMIDGAPYVYSHRVNKKIKFNSLHFQGGAKQFIPLYFIP